MFLAPRRHAWMNEARSSRFSAFLSPTAFRDLVSGRRRGVMASALSGILAAAEVPYTWAVRWRNRRYDLRRKSRPPRRRARNQRRQPHPRRHGQDANGRMDRPPVPRARQIGRHHQPRIRGPQRPQRRSSGTRLETAGRAARAGPGSRGRRPQGNWEFGCQALVLDDAFQHRRIGRDLDIVLLDALEPFGYEHVFPAARSANLWQDWPEPISSPCRGPIC